MARNDYVKTIEVAKERGGLVTASLILQAGGTKADAADRIQQDFPRLGRAEAYEVARSAERRIATAQAAIAAGRAPAALSFVPTPVPGLPVNYRYLAVVTYVHPLSGQRAVMSHWIDSDVPLTQDEVREEALSMEGIVSWTRGAQNTIGGVVTAHEVESVTVAKVQQAG
jgi:hypothetical protein